MDKNRFNVVELSEKELLDEVRRLTHFSQEGSIPLLALYEPYDLDQQPSEVILLIPFLLMLTLASHIFFLALPNLCLIWQIPPTAEYFLIASEDEENPEEGGSTANIESCAEIAEDIEALKGEDNDPANPEASSADHRILDDELTDTAESNHDNEADRAPFVHASLEKFSTAAVETLRRLCRRG
jgi:hypothetical protein